MDEENSIVSGAASTDVGATYSDEDFRSGLGEAFGFETESEEPQVFGDSEEKEAYGNEPVGEPGEEGVPENAEMKETEAAESGEQDEKTPETVSFVESGRKFSAPKEAVEAFAKAVGRSSESLIDVYQKGCNYDKLKAQLDEAKKDGEIFEKLGAVLGISAQQAKEETLANVEKIPIEEMAKQILGQNPGMKKEIAEELARFRIEQQKPKAEAEKVEETGSSEETEGRFREIEIFEANHPEIGKLDNAVIEAWEKTGVSLEAAWAAFSAKDEAAKLRAENERLKRELTFKGQKDYAAGHSPGSATTAAGKPAVDEFVEGLFKEY